VASLSAAAAPLSRANPQLEIVEFARSLDYPRQVLLLDNGDVLVAETRAVYAASSPLKNLTGTRIPGHLHRPRCSSVEYSQYSPLLAPRRWSAPDSWALTEVLQRAASPDDKPENVRGKAMTRTQGTSANRITLLRDGDGDGKAEFAASCSRTSTSLRHGLRRRPAVPHGCVLHEALKEERACRGRSRLLEREA